MNLSYVDLHCHSTASDGTLSPADVVRLARRNGLTALALTDHDTVAGNAEAAAEAAAIKIDFLPGIEISAEFPHPGTLHMLGYGIDPESPSLKNLTTELLAGRDDRNPRMVKKLNEIGVAVTMDEWEHEAKGLVIGRPQLAAILVRKGYVTSIKQAFDKYLAPGGLAYVDKERLPSAKAIELIRQSGGVAVLAHAAQLRTENDGQLNLIVKNLVDQGLGGIEVFHSDHDEAWVRKTIALARTYNLLQTGGSDFHGTNKKDIDLGLARSRRIPRELFDMLVDACDFARRKMKTN
jgi:predicted metal-dependent phosphoesterase TrpH